MELYTGGKQTISTRIGLCLTDDERCARRYARKGGWLHTVEVSDDLVIMTAPDYDRDTDTAPGDTDADLAAWAAKGADVIVYGDEDEQGRQHTTWRIVSARGMAALTLLDSEEV